MRKIQALIKVRGQKAKEIDQIAKEIGKIYPKVNQSNLKQGPDLL